MSQRRFGVFVFAAFALATSSARAAGPTKEQCIAANDAAQDLRRAGKLGKAREQLVVCVSATCPAVVRSDCTERLDEVDKATPTIAFDVKDAAGNDVSGVSVTMDGVLLTKTLGGAAIPVDPGQHQFRFEAPGGVSVEKAILVHEAEKDRHERVVLGTAAGQAPAPAPAPATPASAASNAPPLTSEPSPPSDGSTQRLMGIVAAGAGFAGLVVGGIFGMVSKSTYDNALQNECGGGPNTCSTQGASDGQTAHSQAMVSTVAFVAGGVLLAGGAALYFTAPTGKVAVAPTVGRGEAGLGLSGAW